MSEDEMRRLEHDEETGEDVEGHGRSAASIEPSDEAEASEDDVEGHHMRTAHPKKL